MRNRTIVISTAIGLAWIGAVVFLLPIVATGLGRAPARLN
jgi:hypothetical protein